MGSMQTYLAALEMVAVGNGCGTEITTKLFAGSVVCGGWLDGFAT